MKETANNKLQKSKGIAYYLRIDFRTIQGRLTGGFMSMALISFLLILGANYQWGLMTQNRSYVLQKLRPIKFFSVEVLDKVNEAQIVFEKALLFSKNEEVYEEKYNQVWSKEVKLNRDSLERYVNKLQNNNVTVLFSKMDNQVANLRREYKKANDIYNQRDKLKGVSDVKDYMETYLESTIVPLVTSLEENVNEMSFLIDNLEEEKDNEYMQMAELRPWITFVEFLLAVILAAIIGTLLIMNILKRIRLLRDNLKILADGNIPKEIRESGDELNTLIRAINELSRNLQVIKDFAIEVGNGKFDTEVSVFNNQGELGISLTEMKHSLKSVYEEERRRAWATEGLAKFSEILRRNNDNLELLSHEIISNVVKYLEVNQGGLFLLNKSQKEAFLELKAMYAFDKKKILEKQIKPGEGLIGQAFLEGGIVNIRELPEDYAVITSGLGNARPKGLLIVPLAYNEEVIGIIELASFSYFEEHQINFLKNLSEVIAATIITVISNDNTRRLLEESQNKTEAIKQQEEQLRQNSEELIVTQEGLERSLKKAEKELSRLRIIIDNISHSMIAYDEKGIIMLVNKDAEYIFGFDKGEMLERNISALFISDSTSGGGRRGGEDSFTRTLGGEQLVDEGKIVKAIRKDGAQFEAKMYIQQADFGREKIFVATFEIK